MPTVLMAKVWNLSILATRAEDLPGEWIAHCLNLDVISQGPSLEKALEAVSEAVLMVVSDDLRDGLDPLEARTPAPDECWAKLNQVLRHGQPLSQVEDRSKLRAVVSQLQLHAQIEQFERPFREDADWSSALKPALQLPEAWQIAALESLRGHDCSRPSRH